MTRDETSIIKPYRMWIQSRFLALKVCLPSEAVAEVRAGAFLLNASQIDGTSNHPGIRNKT